MKCNKHQKYQAKFQPRCDCEYCWAIWTLKNQPEPKKHKSKIHVDKEEEKPYHGIIPPCDARAYADYHSTGGSDF